jgi:hypothetical protein
MPLAGAVVVTARAAPRPLSTVACAAAEPAIESHSENETAIHAVDRTIPHTSGASLAYPLFRVTAAQG